MVEATFFIPLVIVAFTQMAKMTWAGIQGWVTILIAFLVGIVVALVDGVIGVTDISVAQGIVGALMAIGLTSTFKKAAGE